MVGQLVIHIRQTRARAEHTWRGPLAAREAVLEDLPALGGSGGCVALGADGVLVAPFTTAGMYRGWVTRDGEITVRIHGDERR